MTTRQKDLFIIVIALLAILGCGYGLGSAFAPRPAATLPPEVSLTAFEETTLSNLGAALRLTPEQEDAILSDLHETSDRIHRVRHEALLNYHLEILALHDRIAPRLAPEQLAILRRNRALLKDTIESRFGMSLDKDPAPAPGL